MGQTIPIACNLDGEDQPARAREMKRLGAALVAVSVEGSTARLRFDSRRVADLEAFVEVESRCCPFFEFQIEVADGAAELAASAPHDGAWAVRGLVAGFVAGWGGLV